MRMRGIATMRHLDGLLRFHHIDYMMIPAISEHLLELAELCKKYRVIRLKVFGSAVRRDFNPSSSDVDLVADFSSTREPGYADRYLDFAESLESLFGRKVDLLTTGSIRNPHFCKAIERDAVTLYESEKHQAA